MGQTKDLEGVSGAAYQAQMHPTMIMNGLRQMTVERVIQDTVVSMMHHMAAVMDPMEGMQLYGVDPRDGAQILEIAHPDMLLRNMRVKVELTQQMPRDVWQYVNVIQMLGKEGFLPRQLVTEQTTKLLNLPVKDMTSVMQQLASDDLYKARMELLKSQAQQALGHFRQAMHNREQNPALLSDGSAPYRLSAEGEDPRLPETITPQGPMQIEAELAPGGY